MTLVIVPPPKGWNEQTTVNNALGRIITAANDISLAVKELQKFVNKIPSEKFAEVFISAVPNELETERKET